MFENEHLGGSDLVSEWVGRERREMDKGDVVRFIWLSSGALSALGVRQQSLGMVYHGIGRIYLVQGIDYLDNFFSRLLKSPAAPALEPLKRAKLPLLVKTHYIITNFWKARTNKNGESKQLKCIKGL